MTRPPRYLAVSRRQAIRFLGAAGALSLVDLRRSRAAFGAACTATPAATEGPFWVDERLERSDITRDPTDGSVRPGVPLRIELTVKRTDADCAPAAGVQVDVWHCDAAGRYSDEAANGTAGRKFLRGYQVTDATGAVRFVTVYPGWYPGRTIHVHYRVRAFDGTRVTYDFTSQLAFDDAVSDGVLARAPYDTRGTRNTTNANDAIYDRATELALTEDGSGGWIGRYTVGIAGLPASSAGGGSCSDLAACGAAVAAALPDPTTASSARRRRIARRLARLRAAAGDALNGAAAASGKRRAKLYARARRALTRLRAVATRAADRGVLGVSLSSLVATVDALLALVPAS